MTAAIVEKRDIIMCMELVGHGHSHTRKESEGGSRKSVPMIKATMPSAAVASL